MSRTHVRRASRLVPDPFGPTQDTSAFRDGVYVTLRLTSSMYHRFHAPHDGRVEHVTYLSGDTWNVNPMALARVERLFCRNERAVLRARLEVGGHSIALVPVAAILAASFSLCDGIVPGGRIAMGRALLRVPPT